ncbi:MAG: hypothetical protein UR28_C0008G0028 [Candidatus Peregrinibacteria bacterium GW2011_GWF2_33_10]|nr:MAG: hypothetical protein UR28_C0008G0028 [Candidatus Peregrinibacteria bacterium GW2011_GWF2_33_10]OGJ44931.1 MAG: hypothetical protein A2272_02710 [Candidatus Peregrinibacteria bacterium RIFOXYA12_FULL_33_12]OGJ45229.1 MAG: hypothetical protein A2263_06685 [Candidatus Peregrinibacteria bacterium RIFOXYA2_FULL_33_21]OGJ51153.1 MAG: hypothetical protein A2307_04770 [Candidatus Peregrinibacteria bacterium RIFOXYB2_FULL_33_20]
MNKICKNCTNNFEISSEDSEFYSGLNLPEPTFCPDCRQQRRLAWRNEYRLYKRKCDATGVEMLSVFSPDKPYTVYNNDYWYSDKWNAKSYAMDFDFSKSFFEQYQILMQKVPQLARSTMNNQNCDFVNQCGWSKDCYLTCEADENELCAYSNYIYNCKTCFDCTHSVKNELCYECIDCRQCYNLKFSQNCQNSSNSWFLKNCIGCMECFGSVNLRNKSYYFCNEKCSKEEYLQKLATVNLTSYSSLQSIYGWFLGFSQNFPHKSMNGVQNENSTGDYLYQTSNCTECYDTYNAKDCKFAFNARNLKKVYDMTVFGGPGGVEFSCDNHEIGDSIRNIYYSDQIWSGCYNVYYSKLCNNNCHDIFGCVGLRHAEYCILNKQYTKEEYENLKTKIIQHIQNLGEFGEFPPISISPFSYNETMAQMYFPLSKEQIQSFPLDKGGLRGIKWKDDLIIIPQIDKIIPGNMIPDTISEIPDDILNWPIQCEISKRPFKIIPSELKFYRDQNLPIPHLHPEERFNKRMSLRNPRKLWTRNCMKCNAEIQTTYSPEEEIACNSKLQRRIVYCENCYINQACL